jgi:UDP-glucose 4-epimerase
MQRIAIASPVMGEDRFYNVGTRTRTSLKEVAKKLLHLTGSNQPIRYAHQIHATFVRNRVGSPKRAALELGFEARVSLDEGLNELISWRRDRTSESTDGRICRA